MGEAAVLERESILTKSSRNFEAEFAELAPENLKLNEISSEAFIGTAEQFYSGGLLGKMIFKALETAEEGSTPHLSWAIGLIVTQEVLSKKAKVEAFAGRGDKVALEAIDKIKTSGVIMQQLIGHFVITHSPEEVESLISDVAPIAELLSKVISKDKKADELGSIGANQILALLEPQVQGAVAAARTVVFLDKVLEKEGQSYLSRRVLDADFGIDFEIKDKDNQKRIRAVGQSKSNQTGGYETRTVVPMQVSQKPADFVQLPVIRCIDGQYVQESPLVRQIKIDREGIPVGEKGVSYHTYDIKEGIGQPELENQFSCIRMEPFVNQDGCVVSMNLDVLRFSEESGFQFEPVTSFPFPEVFLESLTALKGEDLDLFYELLEQNPDVINDAVLFGGVIEQFLKETTNNAIKDIKQHKPKELENRSELTREWLKCALLTVQASRNGYFGPGVRPMYFVTSCFWDLARLTQEREGIIHEAPEKYQKPSVAILAKRSTELLHMMKANLQL